MNSWGRWTLGVEHARRVGQPCRRRPRFSAGREALIVFGRLKVFTGADNDVLAVGSRWQRG